MTDRELPPDRDDPAAGAPRTEGDVARPAPIQIALVLLVVLLALLALAVIWPLLSGN